MNGVRIADLKNHLSEHLRRVRRGSAVTVFDRDSPIARLIPYEEAPGGLEVRPRRAGSLRPNEVPLPPPLALDRDVVDLLLEERQGDR
ncbi:MAG: type II toxin-antitoxin system prevent-host-death family antitoxin [Acidobacteria bacterium]|nr:type II toxin-antitoxin system prevent-host-death family antitoxin [Acidobacteriota bacterium]